MPLTKITRLYLVLGILFCCNTTSAQSPSPHQPYAVIAGGSRGIGFAIAEALARRQYNLVLIARGEAALQAAKDSLEKAYRIRVETLSIDLTDTSSATRIAAFCRDLPVNMLCNVAGLGGARDFGQLPLDSLRYMVRLNLESVITLTATMIPILEKNGPAYILNVASMAGLGPIPSKNVYAATKAAVIYFSYGLRYELASRHISVSYLAPGPVYTKKEVVETTRKRLGKIGDLMEVSPEKVGELCVRQTLQKRMVIVPGFLARMGSIALRGMPKRWSAAIYALSKEE